LEVQSLDAPAIRSSAHIEGEEGVCMKTGGSFWDAVAGRAPAPPGTALLGWKVREIDPEAGTIRVEFDAKPDFCNPTGAIQGGYLAAMLDDTMGPCLHATLEPGHFAPTVELKVSYIRPARPGPLLGEGRVVHKGRSLAFLAGELRTPDGQLVATATATARIVKTE
jgi:uncharacterized protein (TIGR00369 family)